jgi:hypothetical protein
MFGVGLLTPPTAVSVGAIFILLWFYPAVVASDDDPFCE